MSGGFGTRSVMEIFDSMRKEIGALRLSDVSVLDQEKTSFHICINRYVVSSSRLSSSVLVSSLSVRTVANNEIVVSDGVYSGNVETVFLTFVSANAVKQVNMVHTVSSIAVIRFARCCTGISPFCKISNSLLP